MGAYVLENGAKLNLQVCLMALVISVDPNDEVAISD